MGHVNDVGQIRNINFPIIELKNSYYGYCEGYFRIDDSYNGTIDRNIWQLDGYVVGDFQECEDRGAGYITCIPKVMYDAWLNQDNTKWKEFYNNGWAEHLKSPEFKPNSWDRICTVRQLCVTPISDYEYDLVIKYTNLATAYKHLRNEILVYMNDENLPQWLKINVKELCNLTDEKSGLYKPQEEK